MIHKFYNCFLAFLVILPAFSAPKITNGTINDYIDLANLYQNNHQYKKALNYLYMIEPYDSFNPKIIYQKIYLLKSINRIDLAEKELEKLVLLNQDYVCSDLALSIYKQLNRNDICCKKNQILFSSR